MTIERNIMVWSKIGLWKGIMTEGRDNRLSFQKCLHFQQKVNIKQQVTEEIVRIKSIIERFNHLCRICGNFLL